MSRDESNDGKHFDTSVDELADGDVELETAGLLGEDADLHLHGLDGEDGVARRERGAVGKVELEDAGGHGGDVGGVRGVLVGVRGGEEGDGLQGGRGDQLQGRAVDVQRAIRALNCVHCVALRVERKGEEVGARRWEKRKRSS